MSKTAAMIGAGLIGGGWAVVFARAGWHVSLFDIKPGQAATAVANATAALHQLESAGLVPSAVACIGGLKAVDTIEQALDGADYVQENVLETPEEKFEIFKILDRLVPEGIVCGSSSSTIPASRFSESLKTRDRCLVVHPMTPPYLVPVVEIVPAPWTSPQVTDCAMKLMDDIGMTPIKLNKEIFGFVLNRFQVGLINEAMHLVAEGIASPADIEKTLTHGLGLRWSFMGMFQTMDLLAPTGFGEYAGKFGHSYVKLGKDLKVAEPWTKGAVAQVAEYLRGNVPIEDLPGRARWRDEKLINVHRANPLEK